MNTTWKSWNCNKNTANYDACKAMFPIIDVSNYHYYKNYAEDKGWNRGRKTEEIGEWERL